jgi:hypothetical protein
MLIYTNFSSKTALYSYTPYYRLIPYVDLVIIYNPLIVFITILYNLFTYSMPIRRLSRVTPKSFTITLS